MIYIFCCHSERSEESRLELIFLRPFALLRVTFNMEIFHEE
jgi:hypothetical protein